MQIDSKLFYSIFPYAPRNLVEDLLDLAPKYDITTKEQLAMFIAQCGHESNGFSVLEENLNYRLITAKKVFPNRFKCDEDLNCVASKTREGYVDPIKFANKVYGYRMGNTLPDDGYTYRGAGYIQLTGKSNHQAFADHYFKDPVLRSMYMKDPVSFYKNNSEVSLASALFYYHKNRVHGMDTVEKATKKINGGLNGLADRKRLYAEVLGMISE